MSKWDESIKAFIFVSMNAANFEYYLSRLNIDYARVSQNGRELAR